MELPHEARQLGVAVDLGLGAGVGAGEGVGEVLVEGAHAVLDQQVVGVVEADTSCKV